jgi:hypothetical protein
MQRFPPYIDPNNDECYYFREYHPGKGYYYSESNHLIKNFKLDTIARPDLQIYKSSSINKFAEELKLFFTGPGDHYISYIPPSKCRSDSLYDDRMERTLAKLRELKPNIIIEEPVLIRNSYRPCHRGGPRYIKDLISNFEWKGFMNKVIQRIHIIDDVITTGSHFKAYKNFLSANHYPVEVIGLFWASTVDNKSP